MDSQFNGLSPCRFDTRFYCSPVGVHWPHCWPDLDNTTASRRAFIMRPALSRFWSSGVVDSPPASPHGRWPPRRLTASSVGLVHLVGVYFSMQRLAAPCQLAFEIDQPFLQLNPLWDRSFANKLSASAHETLGLKRNEGETKKNHLDLVWDYCPRRPLSVLAIWGMVST